MKTLSLLMLTLLLLQPVCAQSRRVLYIGDSITDGAWGNNKKWNASSEERNQTDMNHIYGHGFMSLCASYYQGAFPERDYCFWNRGISGNTLKDLHSRWSKDVIELEPDVVSILIGTNDVHLALGNHETLDLQVWEAEYRHLLDTTITLLPKIRFVIGTPFVSKVGKLKNTADYNDRERLIKELDSIVRRIADDYQAILIPFDELFTSLQDNLNGRKDTYWIWDGIHPTPAGHYRMAELWKEKAGKLLTE